MATQMVPRQERTARLLHDYSDLVKDLREMVDAYEAVLKEELNKQGLEMRHSASGRSFYALETSVGLLENQKKEADALIEEQDECHSGLAGEARYRFKLGSY